MAVRPTLQNIARLVNVSPSLVSHVLNDRPGLRVADGTRLRIQDAARELGYRPVASARALKTGRSMQIAVFADYRSGQAGRHQPNVAGLIDVAAENRYRVVMAPMHGGEEGEQELEFLLADRACDGLCMFATQIADRHFDVLKRYNTPCVLVGDLSEAHSDLSELPWCVHIDVDNRALAADAITWLRAQGHERIAWASIAGESEEFPHIRLLHSSYESALAPSSGGPLYLQQNGAGRAESAHEVGATAVITRWTSETMRWLLDVERQATSSNHEQAQDLTVMGLLDQDELPLFRSLGLGARLAVHCYSLYEETRFAGQVLMSMIGGALPTERRILVAPTCLGWCRPD